MTNRTPAPADGLPALLEQVRGLIHEAQQRMIGDALRHDSSWTLYCPLLRVDTPATRQWYADEAA